MARPRIIRENVCGERRDDRGIPARGKFPKGFWHGYFFR
jgi:hypothetical protein